MRPNLSIALAKMAFTSSTFETSSPTTRARFTVSTSYFPLSSAWSASGLREVAMTDCPAFRSSCNRLFPSPEEVPVTVQTVKRLSSINYYKKWQELDNSPNQTCFFGDIVLDYWESTEFLAS